MKRGDIYYIEREYNEVGSEQRAGRPAIIVSNEANNENAETVEVVFDPFMGSGTTAKCAVALKRHYLGFEISKEYCEIIKRRIAFEDAPKGIANGADVPSDHQQMKIDF